MPTVDQYEPGTPSWVDLASPDLPSSVSFYRDLFGWEPDDQGPDAGGYHHLPDGWGYRSREPAR